MKIQAINHINFQGIYIDKSKENNGNWKIEYKPYSWELSNTTDSYYDKQGHWHSENRFGTAEQIDVDLKANKLPDNEKIYIPPKEIKYWAQTGRESCHDILGTEFYYRDFDSKSMRNKIDHMEALNREDSLRIYNKKLAKFLEMKDKRFQELESELKTHHDNIKTYSSNFNSYSIDYDRSFIDRCRSKDTNESSMVNEKERMTKEFDSFYKKLEEYIGIRQSLNDTKNLILKNEKEIAILEEARNAGRLIDISQRVSTYDPNKPLWEALKDVSKSIDKIVALPHRTISVKSILGYIGETINSGDVSDKAIKYIDELIHKARCQKI